MLNLYFIDFEEVLEVCSQGDTNIDIQFIIQSKKLPNETKFRVLNENGEVQQNNIFKSEQKAFIQFILEIEMTFIFDLSKEEHILTINIFEKISVLINKLKTRFGLLDYDLQLMYQNKVLKNNQSIYFINKSIRQLTCKITQKNYFLYQNQSNQIQFNSFLMIEQFYQIVSNAFNKLQNFEIYYKDTLINRQRAQELIIYYQISPGESLIIQEYPIIKIENEIQNKEFQLSVTGNCLAMKQEIIRMFYHDKDREYMLSFKGREIQDQEEITKIKGAYCFNYKIQDVSFYVCQRNFEALKKRVTMKYNKQIQDIQFDFPQLKSKNYQFIYKNMKVDFTQTFQDINLVNGDCLIYDIIEHNIQKQPQIDKPKEQIQEQPIIKQQLQQPPLFQKTIIENKIIEEPQINQKIKENNQTIDVSFEFESGKLNSYNCSLKDTFSKIKESLQLTESVELLYKNEEISNEQTMESINYKEGEIIKIRFLQKQLEINKETQLLVRLEDRKTKKVTQYVAEQQEKVGEFLARYKYFSHGLYYKGKQVDKQITFYARGIISNEKLEIDQQ